MKRIILTVFGALLLLGSVSAQTYVNGTWYSMYDNDSHAMNTISSYTASSGIFAPTNGQLHVNWKYEKVEITGWFRNINTKIYESGDGGSSTSQIGSLDSNTDFTSHTESFSVSKNINWLKFDRPTGATHKVTITHLDIPLAKHILLASGTYGKSEIAKDFGGVQVLSTSDAQTVSLRSFLTNGDITISSSNPEIFHVGDASNTGNIVYNVGANACASANGSAAATATGVLAKISNYNFNVYFTPKVGQDYSAVITITDGTSTAKVNVSGKGEKFDQSINWSTEETILSTGSIATATATSDLDVTYSFSPEGVVTFEDGEFKLNIEDEEVHQVTITASQAGNELYSAAENVVKTITINPAVTHYAYKAGICSGDKYSDELFTDELDEAKDYEMTIQNVYGGDSIVTLTLDVYPTYAFLEELAIYENDEVTWQGKDLSVYEPGNELLSVHYETIHGCDSIYTLQLLISPRILTYGKDTITLCSGDKVEYEGTVYKRAGEYTVTLPRRNVYGGDSIVTLTVNVLPSMRMSESLTITEGDVIQWQEYDLSEQPIGETELVATYTTVGGCDSIITLHLTVVEREAALNDTYTNAQKVQKVIVNGQLFILKGTDWYDVCGRKVETK